MVLRSQWHTPIFMSSEADGDVSYSILIPDLKSIIFVHRFTTMSNVDLKNGGQYV